jgi:hypothetical protein
MTATEELERLLRHNFPFQWRPITDPLFGVYVKDVEKKHVIRALELIPEVLTEQDWDRGYVEGKEEAISEFDVERIELEEKIEDLEEEVKRLEELLQFTRNKIHVSNEDEE